MMRIAPNTNNRLVVYRPQNPPTQRRPAPSTSSVSSEGSSNTSNGSAAEDPTSASLSERANFFAGRAWINMTGVADLKGFKHSVGRLPPPEWYDRFTSDDHVVRAQAYWENRDRKVGLIWLTDWDGFTDRVTRLQETADMIKLHLVLSRLFGDVSYEDMREAARGKEMKVAPERVKRHYVARILSKSYTSTEAFPGWCHEREAGYIVGAVDEIREMYQSLRLCLDNPGVRRKLALVPSKNYTDFLPKKAPSLASLELDAALPTSPGPSLFQNFKSMMAQLNKPRQVPSPYQEYELEDWGSDATDW